MRETCRRCEADLRLVLRAHLRFEFVKRLHAEAISRGDSECEQTLASEMRCKRSLRLGQDQVDPAVDQAGLQAELVSQIAHRLFASKVPADDLRLLL